jgi:hypothetical protein
MLRTQACRMLTLMILLAAPAARPQPSPQQTAGFANPFDNPTIRKYWNPVVGTGAVFWLERNRLLCPEELSSASTGATRCLETEGPGAR